MLHGSHKSDVFWIGRMDGADATCRICRVYVHITGLGLDLMREELACCVYRFVRSVLFFETTNTSPQGTIRIAF